MSERATLEELKDFANKVREAGGGNPIDALMPAIPQDAHQCLIARNLNFNCRVANGYGKNHNQWAMRISDPAVAEKIADALSLETITNWEGGDVAGVVLPDRIGQVAEDFDAAEGLIISVLDDAEEMYYREHCEWPEDAEAAIPYYRQALENRGAAERSVMHDFIPYIAEAGAEARQLATMVNEHGEIVV